MKIKEKIKEKIKGRYHNWKTDHPWVSRSLVYLLLLCVWIIIWYTIFSLISLFSTEATSARYPLSTLVQTQAAIVAIIVSLTLVAVQVTASTYSPRVIDIFKHNPDMWLLLGFYCVSMSYGLILLKQINAMGGTFLAPPMAIFVSIAYWLGTYTLIIIFPYMRNILSILKPEEIIKQLTKEITKDKLAKSDNAAENPILSVMDIVYGAIKNYDTETARSGLQSLTDKITGLIDAATPKEIIDLFCRSLNSAGRLTIRNDDDISTAEVITCLGELGTSTAVNKLKGTTDVASYLCKVGIDAANNKLEYATEQAANYLGKMGVEAVRNELRDATDVVAGLLRKLGEVAVKNELEYATDPIVNAIGKIGMEAARNELENLTEQAAIHLGKVGLEAARKDELKSAARMATKHLCEMGVEAVKNGLKAATVRAAYYIARLTATDEELARAGIHDCELNHEDQDAYHEFMTICKNKRKEPETSCFNTNAIICA